jgi:hypothetical protein
MMAPRPTQADLAAEAHTERAMMARDIADLRNEVADLRGDIQSLVDAWKNANFALSAVKWVSGVVIATSALWFVVTHFGTGK